MKKRLNDLFVASIFLLLTVLAQQLCAQKSAVYYDHYTANDGLPTQTIYTLLQDRNGFLWIATEAGVSCFDGKEFKNYTTEDGLGDNEVLYVYEDKKGRIWFLPFSAKLSYYYKGKFYNESNDPLLKQIPARYIYSPPIEDENGNLYFNLFNDPVHILKINTDNTFSNIDIQKLIGETDSISILYRSNNRKSIYCITKHRRLLDLKADGTYSIGTFHTRFNEKLRARWFCDPKNPENLIYVNENGIHLVTDTNVRLIISDNSLRYGEGKLNIVLDKYKNVWVSHPVRNTLFFRHTDSGYLNPVRILPTLFAIIAFDNENNVWFCSSNQGLFKLSFSKLLNDAAFNINQKLLQKNALCIHATKNGDLWIGHSNGYVTQVSGSEVIHHNINFSNRTHNRILQIFADDDGDVWCGGDETCVLLKRLPNGTYSAPQQLKKKDNKFYNMPIKGFTISPGGELIATSNSTQMLLNKQKMRATDVKRFSPYGNRLYSSFFNKKGNKYVSSVNGLLLIKGDTVINLAGLEPKLNTRIQHFTENSKGTVFLATYSDGLLALENNRVVKKITHKDGLGNICRRVINRNDTLYIATNGGITIATYNNRHFDILLHIGQANGLPSVDVNDISFWKNTMYVATSEGIAAISLPVPKLNMVPPPQVTLLSFTVNNTDYNTTSAIVFPYKQQRVNMEFIAPVMDKPATVQYRYRLGPMNEWHVITTNQLEFNDLQQGSYTIELQAKKYNSGWGASKKLSFTITPPYYATWWFRLLVIMAFAFGLYTLVRYILTKRFNLQLAELKQKEAIEKERNRIAADIHDDIGSELTNIVILSRILKEEKKAEKPYENIVDKIEKSSNEVINKMNEVIWTLNASNDTLHNLAAYLRNYINTFLSEQYLKGNITIYDDVYSEIQIKAETSRNIFLIVKEILHNIVKHAKASEVTTEICIEKNMLQIEISDNGAGFDILKQSHGNGLQNMRKRAGYMNGKIKIESQPGIGTTIKTLIPV